MITSIIIIIIIIMINSHITTHGLARLNICQKTTTVVSKQVRTLKYRIKSTQLGFRETASLAHAHTHTHRAQVEVFASSSKRCIV